MSPEELKTVIEALNRGESLTEAGNRVGVTRQAIASRGNRDPKVRAAIDNSIAIRETKAAERRASRTVKGRRCSIYGAVSVDTLTRVDRLVAARPGLTRAALVSDAVEAYLDREEEIPPEKGAP